MADARSLLRAKREQERVSHPLASYASGTLKCTACGIPVKNASAWAGHVGSKAHRSSVTRLKESRKKEEEERASKRKAALISHDELSEIDDDKHSEEDESSHPAKRPKTINANAGSGFPADFFSDPSRSIPQPPDSDEGDEDETIDAKLAIEEVAVPASDIDVEWLAFQSQVVNVPADTDEREVFTRATIFSEPQLNQEIPEGFPETVLAPSLQLESQAVIQPEEPTEEEIRKGKEQEEKELIMDRILEEERAQEEADEKVALLKARVEALKKRRQNAKANRK